MVHARRKCFFIRYLDTLRKVHLILFCTFPIQYFFISIITCISHLYFSPTVYFRRVLGSNVGRYRSLPTGRRLRRLQKKANLRMKSKNRNGRRRNYGGKNKKNKKPGKTNGKKLSWKERQERRRARRERRRLRLEKKLRRRAKLSKSRNILSKM